MSCEVGGISESGELFLPDDLMNLPTGETSPVSISPSETSYKPLEALSRLATSGDHKHNVKQVLKKCFGSSLTKRAMALHPVQKWPDNLDAKHCLLLISTIGHLVTKDDLEQAYAEVKSGKPSMAILNQAEIPFLRTLWSSSFQALPTYWVNHLLQLFRHPLTDLGPKLEELDIYKDRTLSYTYYDYAIKQLEENGNRNRPEFYLASRELLAKYVAYALPASTSAGMLVPIYSEETDQTEIYQVNSQLNKNGLNSYILTPLKSASHLPNVLLFRGTDDPESMHRDFDPTGVGKTVYETQRETLLEMVEKTQSKTGSKKLEIIGHSLGGVDGQRLLTDLTASDRVKNFEELNLYAFCSPRLDKSTLEIWESHLKELKETAEPPKIHLSFAQHENDLATYVGDAHLSPEKTPFVHCTYLIVKSFSGISDSHMHHTVPFFKDGVFDSKTDNRSFLLVQNCTDYELNQAIQRLEELRASSRWYLAYSHYILGESIEELEARIDHIRQNQTEFETHTTPNDTQSWFTWSVSLVQPMLHRLYGWLNKVKLES